MWLKVIFFIVTLGNVKAVDDFIEDNRRVLQTLPAMSQNEGARYFEVQRGPDGEMTALVAVQQMQGSLQKQTKEGKDINIILKEAEPVKLPTPSPPRDIFVVNKRPIQNEPEPQSDPTPVVSSRLPEIAPKPISQPTIVVPAPKSQPAPSQVVVIPAKQPESAPNQVVIIPAAKPESLPKPGIIAPALIPNYNIKTPVQPVTYERPVLKILNNQLVDYECRNANGYFATPNDCNRFVECKELKAYYYECPDGMNFNRDAVWPNYPCGISREVQCETKVERVPQLTRECPSHNGLYALPDSDCSNYISCLGGIATVMTCPKGLVFNPTVQSCDWLENMPSCKSNVFSGFTCPSFQDDEEEDSISKYRYGQSCAEYIACHRGVPRLLKCDAGLGFDDQLERCVDADRVQSCYNDTL